MSEPTFVLTWIFVAVVLALAVGEQCRRVMALLFTLLAALSAFQRAKRQSIRQHGGGSDGG